jgi:hypothetical protein
MMVTCQSKMFESSTRPAEKPSTGFLVSSAPGQAGNAGMEARLHDALHELCRTPMRREASWGPHGR